MPYNHLGQQVPDWHKHANPNDYFQTRQDYETHCERQAARSESYGRGMRSAAEGAKAVSAGGALFCVENPCASGTCATLCLAASIASCVDPLGAANLCASFNAAKVSAGITGCASATCACCCVAKTCEDKGSSTQVDDVVVTMQPTSSRAYDAV